MTAGHGNASVTTRTQHINEIYAEIAELFKTRTTAEWTRLLDEADIPVTPMHTLETIFEDPHLVATGFFEREDHPTEGRLVRMREPSEWSDTQPAATRHARDSDPRRWHVRRASALSHIRR